METTTPTSERLTLLASVNEKLPVGDLNILVTQVDPDALGSALGLAYLCAWAFDRTSKIYYAGAVSHQQNQCIFNKFNLKQRMNPLSEFAINTNEKIKIALTDSSRIADSRIERSLNIDPVIIIDHHRDTDVSASEEKFIWIDEGVGSASTMVTELIKEFGEQTLGNGNSVSFEGEWECIPYLLALGIYTDTNSLVASGPRDRDAYDFIAEFVSHSELAKLIRYRRKMSYYKQLCFALNNLRREGSKVVTGLGIISENDGDNIASIADFLFEMDGATLIIVWGIVGKKVRICARSEGLSNALDDYLRSKFGTRAGAKKTPNDCGVGGALLDFEPGMWMNTATEETQMNIVKQTVENIVFNKEE